MSSAVLFQIARYFLDLYQMALWALTSSFSALIYGFLYHIFDFFSKKKLCEDFLKIREKSEKEMTGNKEDEL